MSAQSFPAGPIGAIEPTLRPDQPFIDFRDVWLAYNDELLARQQFAVEAIDLHAPSGVRIALGISIGVFHCAPRFDPVEALAAADRNLYRAKSMGRNTVVA